MEPQQQFIHDTMLKFAANLRVHAFMPVAGGTSIPSVLTLATIVEAAAKTLSEIKLDEVP